MARRRRSYRKNSDDLLGTFLNNAAASGQKKATAARREREAAARRDATAARRSAARAAKEAEQARKRRAREAEKERKAAERAAEARRKAEEKERERVRKEQAKHDEKVGKVVSRVLLDLESEGLFRGEATAIGIAQEAVETSVTPSQAKKYLILPRMDAVAESCALDFVEGIIDCEDRFRARSEYAALVTFVAGFRPQGDAAESEEYKALQAVFETAMSEQLEQEALEEREREAREGREIEREQLYKELRSSKTLFQDELEEFLELISDQDLSSSQALETEEYKRFVRNKQEYWASINAQLSEFDL